MRRILFVGIPIVVFCSFLIGVAGAAIFPSIQKWPAPILCQKPYATMIVNSQSGNYTPNLSVETFSDACTDNHHHFKPISALEDSGIVFLETSMALTMLLVLLAWLILIVRRMGPQPTTPGALTPK